MIDESLAFTRLSVSSIDGDTNLPGFFGVISIESLSARLSRNARLKGKKNILGIKTQRPFERWNNWTKSKGETEGGGNNWGKGGNWGNGRGELGRGIIKEHWDRKKKVRNQHSSGLES